ncbi:hypothetical protein PP7435_CHR2-2089 [Komagataella phaffii CBS 7435]|uniref:VanZ-like domain-containing protein n=2 Tax=Komagataella phaffii TaxID=460519 RepID=C4R1C1_KOMPG|nr:Hypothetical protein PAS_chr2-1_0650 [Komagataella phaffii GS115]CAH2448177.1 Hypothetical protein BQ9382_C2-3425 [Komagataella phaffii CBS 7435]CAY69295.1 Hypothetical protein PAS_chr2-1_0650 [Komagataella phaffii GS115]SCV12042.1 hypothetical protein PP7435_CHR2-2089 [Komagataella phaffii CBS 7435]
MRIPVRKNVFIAFILGLIVAGLLGFTRISLNNDKLLHFLIFFLLTTLFYWSFEIKSIRVLRFLTIICCIILGGVASEFLQGFLAYREFDWRDIICNVGGSTAALAINDMYMRLRNKKQRQLRYKRIKNKFKSLHNLESQLDDNIV